MNAESNREIDMRLETITPDNARALLMSAGTSPDDVLGTLDPAKVLHFSELLRGVAPERGVWHSTMASIWIDPGGRVRDGLHRLYACTATGQDMEVVVVRGKEWTSIGQLMADDILRNWMTEEEWREGALRAEVGL